jgi:IPT/TIG domain-containing protein
VNRAFVADDDDGNLSNGVPHLTELTNAARAHNFSIPQPPTLQSATPGQVGRCPGATVTVRGTNFVPGATQVQFNGTNVTVTSVGAGQLTVTDPGGGVQGPITIVVSTPFGSATLPNALVRTGAYLLVNLEPALIGHSFQLRLCGEANARYFVVASLSQAGTTYQGVPLNVGPGLRVISDSLNGAASPLDGTGTRVLTVPVPNLQNLALRHAYFQGWVVPPSLPPALTNVADVQFFPASN